MAADNLARLESVVRRIGKLDDARLDGGGVARKDGWASEALGLGTGRDKQTSWEFRGGAVAHNDPLYTQLLSEDHLIRKAMALLPKEAMRKGWTVSLATEDKDKEQDVTKLLTALKVKQKLVQGWTFGRTYGGCGLILGIDDGQSMDKPLALDRIKPGGFKFINVLDRRYLQVERIFNNPLEPNYGEPELYKLQQIAHFSAPGNQMGDPAQNASAAMGQIVHASRVLIFEGAETAIDVRQQLSNWWQSEITLILDDVRDFQANVRAISYLITEASIGVYKIKDLIALIEAGKEQVVLKRLQMLDMAKSVARSMVLDAEEEDFSKNSETFTGLPDLYDRLEHRVASALGYPVTLLFGRSPAGQNATGESDFRQFYDRAETEREEKIRHKLEFLVDVALISLGEDPEKAKPDVQFPSLWGLTDQEQADRELKTAQKDSIYVNAGVLDPAEVAVSRWDEQGVFKTETRIDRKIREIELKANREMALNPPPPPPLPVVAPPPPPGEPRPPAPDAGNDEGVTDDTTGGPVDDDGESTTVNR